MTEINIVEQVDMVDHPPHYTVGDIECIDAIKASMTHEAYMGYLKGACLKYLWRYTYKKNRLRTSTKLSGI